MRMSMTRNKKGAGSRVVINIPTTIGRHAPGLGTSGMSREAKKASSNVGFVP